MTTTTRTGNSQGTRPPRDHRDRADRDRYGHARPTSEGPPDLAAIAEEAVVRFLRTESASTTEQDVKAAGPAAEADLASVRDRLQLPAAGRGTSGLQTLAQQAADPAQTVTPNYQDEAQAISLRAAALSVATLNRVESAAASLEADIAAARRAQAELEVRAGSAARQAVRAAQAAWSAAGSAQQASNRSAIIARRIKLALLPLVLLVMLELVVAFLFAVSSH